MVRSLSLSDDAPVRPPGVDVQISVESFVKWLPSALRCPEMRLHRLHKASRRGHIAELSSSSRDSLRCCRPHSRIVQASKRTVFNNSADLTGTQGRRRRQADNVHSLKSIYSSYSYDELVGYPSEEDLSPNAATRPSSCWGRRSGAPLDFSHRGALDHQKLCSQAPQDLIARAPRCAMQGLNYTKAPT